MSNPIKWIDVLRWIAVLPMAAGSYVLIPAAWKFVSYELFETPYGRSPQGISGFLEVVIGAVAFVYCGAKTAPSRRFMVSVILASVHASLSMCLIALVSFGGAAATRIVYLAFLWLSGLAATVQACKTIYEEDGAEPSFEDRQRDVALPPPQQ